MSHLEHQCFSRSTLAFLRGEEGQIIPWVILLMFFFLGMCALTIDVGHAMLVQRELQASTDAAALAAAQRLDYSDYATYALNYSAAAGKYNQYTDYGSSTPTITPYCSATVAGPGFNIPCTATSPNAVMVTETVAVPMFFTQYIGIPTMNVGASAYASKGAIPQPYNVAIILDTTPSMNYSDSSCHDENGNTIYVNGKYATQLQCATLGVQQLLTGLAPSVDYLSLFTFPAITTTSISAETDCSGSTQPNVTAYTFPTMGASSLTNPSYTGAIYNSSGSKVGTGTYTSTYQVVGYATDYRSNDKSTTISTSSSLANAVGVGTSSNCTGMQSGYNNTYYAAAIYAAQSTLIAEQSARAQSGITTKNAIILLSDGNATAKSNGTSTFSPGSNDMVTSSTEATSYATNSGKYPSWIAECNQGIAAANAATLAGTTVFAVAYGSPTTSNSSNCNSDRNLSGSLTGSPTSYTNNVTPCQAMQLMSSGWASGIKTHFFADSTVNGSSSGCQAADQNQSTSSLTGIFKAIRGQMSTARLIPPEPTS